MIIFNQPGSALRLLLPACLLAASLPIAHAATNLLEDPSFEVTKNRDQFGFVFAKWGGWKFEGDCNFEVGEIAHSGKTSGLLQCNSAGKIRINQIRDVQPGRYLITAYIRGLNIGEGAWGSNTEFMFNEKYIPLHHRGSFGWTKLTYVADLDKPTKAGPSFGLWAPGLLWIDDVSMELVGKDVKLTDQPVLGKEEAPIEPPSPLGAGAVHCPRCAYRNMPAWKRCYACGASLTQTKTAPGGPPEKLITSFEKDNPFSGGSSVVSAHATEGSHSLRIDGQAMMKAPQNWGGYDFLKVDTYTDAKDPVALAIEIQDSNTTDYWTRVNYNAVAPPGKSTLTLSLNQLYVGEKSRPGRNLILTAITRLVLTPAPGASLFIDNLRLERDLTGPQAIFDGLQAFDFGPGNSPVLDGFTAVTPATIYSRGRGFGLKNAKIWRAFDVLQPDPLYQDYICIESGGFAVDVPNGRWRVIVNVDAAAGFWGENQIYHTRAILAQGKTVVSEKQDFQSFQKKYYTFWDKDDLPGESVSDKYGKAHFSEKTFDVEVTNGQLFIEFRGENWANSVSSLIAFPVEKAAEGKRFLDYVKERRRFYFDNSFKPALHRPTGDPLQPTAEDTKQGLVWFQRDLMKDLYYNDTPFRSETGKPLSGESFQGQIKPLVAGVVPLRDLGSAHVAISDLVGPAAIPAGAIEIGYGSYRLTRVSIDGAVYTIAPRWIVPKSDVDLPKSVARSFWFTVHTPPNAAPGIYKGKVTLTAPGGVEAMLPVQFMVKKGELDPVNIPVGPFGGSITSRWFEDDPLTQKFTAELTAKSMRLLRDRGFTMFSGVPTIGFEVLNGRPTVHLETADRQMQEAKKLGFLAVDSYGAGIQGFDAYYQDLDKMKAAGYSTYSSFIRAIYSAVEKHAQERGWIPVYWNIGDEPNGDDLKRSIANAQAYHEAFPSGPPFFTIATSVTSASDPRLMLARSLTVPTLSDFDEAGINMLRQQGGHWAQYGFGSRWYFGDYLYKAVSQFDLKFRMAWHWNAVAGDPYYALDSREDDYAWANSTPTGQLVPSIEFARISAGLDDYRELLTAARLAKSKAGTPAAKSAERLIASRMAAFTLNDRDHDAKFRVNDWESFEREISDALEALQ
jgi:hypothetical protein